MKQTILVVGSGGREHALVWKLAQSPLCGKIYAAPGNGGTGELAENVAIGAHDIPGLVSFATEHKVDLTVVGPDDALAAGITDAFEAAGLRIFGPTRAAAQIEASKAFSKSLMNKSGIPTATYQAFGDLDQALAYVRTQPAPLVVKASGLALGKGVIICHSREEAERAVTAIMGERVFGAAGNEVVIEEFLAGQEVSAHALSDGKSAVLLPSSQDYKQIGEGDTGPNTGGMGVVAPVPWLTADQMERVREGVVEPALAAMRAAGRPFAGCLYPGLMVGGGELKVLEFNARFGDPETQAYMRLLDSDLLEVLNACVDGRLAGYQLKWKPGFAACVTLASGGYPGTYKKGLPIAGIEEAGKLDDVMVFHAGTVDDGGVMKTSGGRVLSVTAIGTTLDEALNKAYAAIDQIKFEGMYFRSDIGRRTFNS